MSGEDLVSKRSVDSLNSEHLLRLHPEIVDEPNEVSAFVQLVCEARLPLTHRSARAPTDSVAHVSQLGSETIVFDTEGTTVSPGDQVLLNVTVAGRPHFFVVSCLQRLARGKIRTDWPGVIYRAERRDRLRQPATETQSARARIRDGSWIEGSLLDASPAGLGIGLPGPIEAQAGDHIEISMGTSPTRSHAIGEVRSTQPIADRPGWRRLGIQVTPQVPHRFVAIEDGARSRFAGLAAPRAADHRPAIPDGRVDIVEYQNRRGERLRAIIDSVGTVAGSPIVVIPPAWGHTKETLLPLAATILATAEAAGVSVSVLRFDGTRRKGESYNDLGDRTRGRETTNFTFSQAVDDLEATVSFARAHLAASSVLLVTFSAAAIEGRRVAANNRDGCLKGWVSVVGAPDPQSLIRVISGGIDYFAGYEKGARFGLREVQGLTLDVDNAASDAIEHRLAFLDDARRDFAQIGIPVTWIHGKADAWMDPARVRDILRFGAGGERRLIELPTGHQLRTSQEAAATFQLVASEVMRMALGRKVPGVPPNRGWLRRRRRAELKRRPRASIDLRSFWRGYLMGGEGRIGMDLVASTEAYEELMAQQVAGLHLEKGVRILDLGSGVGTFPRFLDARGALRDINIIELDYVVEALRRAQESMARGQCAFVAADLDLSNQAKGLPIEDKSVDRVLGSLVLNYLPQPLSILRELHRVLRPGGRLVLSSLRRDADVSQICVTGVAELRSGTGHRVFGREGERMVAASLPAFINDAGRLLDLEHDGVFRFWTEKELRRLAVAAGFRHPTTKAAFGKPPQAYLLEAHRD